MENGQRRQVGRPAAGIRLNIAPWPASYLVFGDIEGKLDVLRVECTKCDRKAAFTSTGNAQWDPMGLF